MQKKILEAHSMGDPIESAFNSARLNIHRGLSIPVLSSSPSITSFMYMLERILLVSDHRYIEEHYKRAPYLSELDKAKMKNELLSASNAVQFAGETPDQDEIYIRREWVRRNRKDHPQFMRIERTIAEEVSHSVGYSNKVILADADNSPSILPEKTVAGVIEKIIMPARAARGIKGPIDPSRIMVDTRGFDVVYRDGDCLIGHPKRKQMEEMRATLLRTILTVSAIAAGMPVTTEPDIQFPKALAQLHSLAETSPNVFYKE